MSKKNSWKDRTVVDIAELSSDVDILRLEFQAFALALTDIHPDFGDNFKAKYAELLDIIRGDQNVEKDTKED